ncbi:MAG: S-layer homology domain-containing protein, partial [Clostridia bacterium]|nr:S-layer homology domain-containing protein [Clostridia bacterium]
ASEFAALYYLPDGSGETSVIYYTAYDSTGDYYLEGTISLYADEFLLLTGEITSEDVIQLDGATFEDAFLDLDSDYEYLDYVTFTKPASGDGYLYVEYDEDDSKHTSIGASTKYYVEDDSKALIDDITYVPGKDTEGVVIIKFKAIGYNDNNKKVTVDGVMQITVTVAADITINAGKEQTVEIDPDLFLEFIEDYDTSNKDLEIVSVTISGAPYQAKKGYLVTDGEELNKSGDKTFYADEDDVDVKKKKYDLFDLSFLGGEKDGTVEATFKVTYLRAGSTTKRYAEGTIDFVTGAAVATSSLSGSTVAAKVVNFGESVTLSSFAALGNNKNEYIVFDTLPVGAKLVYNWGKSNQEDVKIGTKYYLSYKAGEKLMANVTFVPSYSASKIQKPVTMDIKGYNANGKAIAGKVNITVTYAAASAQFYDVATSTYADSVDFLYNQGITTGATATTFNPNGNVKRAEFVTFLWRAAGSPVVTGVTNKFTDVKSTGEFAYAYQAILWAVQKGITTGTSATTFSPAANVTHEQLITFLYRYDVNLLGHSGTGSYSVGYTGWSTVPEYAQIPAKWAAYKGILTDSTTYPTAAGTRATVALWLHRMLTL